MKRKLKKKKKKIVKTFRLKQQKLLENCNESELQQIGQLEPTNENQRKKQEQKTTSF